MESFKSSDGSRNSISYVGSWINANEIKSVAVSAILRIIITGTREMNNYCSNLTTGFVETDENYTPTLRGILNGHQDSIQNLVDRTVFLENKTGPVSQTTLSILRMTGYKPSRLSLSTRLEEISRRLDDVALQQRNIAGRVGELGERGDNS